MEVEDIVCAKHALAPAPRQEGRIFNYCKVTNFRTVLNFVLFVLLKSTKFKTG